MSMLCRLHTALPMDQLVAARAQYLEIGQFVATALRSWATVMDLKEARSPASRYFAAVTGADHRGLAGFRRDGRVVGLTGFPDDSITLDYFSRYGLRAAICLQFGRAALFLRRVNDPFLESPSESRIAYLV